MRRVFLAGLVLAAIGLPASAEPLPPLLPPPQDSQPAQTSSAAAAGEELVGLFEIRKGVCGGIGVTSGSYFRMIQPGGNLQAGPFVENNDSPCAVKSYTPLTPGSDGGFATSGFQPHPDPAFDSVNGLNAKITQPQSFFNVKFSTATNQVDPQTALNVVAPRITVSGGSLSGDIRSFAAGWNAQHFNQGSPKPDGSKPGNTSGPTGTYDAATKSFALDWSSHIVGGPFNNFTGRWHFEGTFRSGVTPPGVQPDSNTGVRGGRARQSRDGLAATGAEWRPGLGAVLLVLSAGLFVADRRRLNNDE